MQKVTASHTTLETKNKGRITWLEKSIEVNAAEELSNGTVSINKVMNLTLTSTQVVDGLWVFDFYTVVRLTSNKFLWFEKPLIKGDTELPLNQINTNFTTNVNFMA